LGVYNLKSQIGQVRVTNVELNKKRVYPQGIIPIDCHASRVLKSCIKMNAKNNESKVARVLTRWSCQDRQHGTPHGACGVYHSWQTGELSQHRGELSRWMPWQFLTYIHTYIHTLHTVILNFPLPLPLPHTHTFIHSSIDIL
jgi:hypothetical protein